MFPLSKCGRSLKIMGLQGLPFGYQEHWEGGAAQRSPIEHFIRIPPINMDIWMLWILKDHISTSLLVIALIFLSKDIHSSFINLFVDPKRNPLKQFGNIKLILFTRSWLIGPSKDTNGAVHIGVMIIKVQLSSIDSQLNADITFAIVSNFLTLHSVVGC